MSVFHMHEMSFMLHPARGGEENVNTESLGIITSKDTL
jgi:hypothetical protein